MQAYELLRIIEQFTDLRSRVQHELNPLHIYVKLRKVGIKKSRALQISKAIEKIITPKLYKGHLQSA